MTGGAGPWVLLGFAHNSRLHGIALDIPDCGPKMLFVERTREEAALPEMATEFVAPVETE